MKLVRFVYKKKIFVGKILGDKVVPISGKPRFKPVLLENVKLLSPVAPSKVVLVGLNYRDHAKELGMPLPNEPIIFIKPASSVIGPDDVIEYPPESERVDYEAEIAVVIKNKVSCIAPSAVEKNILGYTCLNDVTARDIQKSDGQWTRSKSFDTFCPIGPWIETDLDPTNLAIKSYLNGDLKQNSSTSEFIFKIPELVSFISRVMTLFPGDVISTGTPHGIGPMKPGDTIVVEIEGIGQLRNFVRRK
ncbi:MAG TPA: fumarylacetoacetate hydrolase family protein [Candidatus Omnitrophota bacterium]|nr:fumarylacetoacetate hydrolase family protein [Candidatus Omnitrophota bacterium]HPS20327.1 fumarylacetoacetate hydrolase family protein [Candidatus Omnitrophota bacterium]